MLEQLIKELIETQKELVLAVNKNTAAMLAPRAPGDMHPKAVEEISANLDVTGAAETATAVVDKAKGKETVKVEKASKTEKPDNGDTASEAQGQGPADTQKADEPKDEAAPDFDYATLQRAVLDLVKKDRNKAVEILQGFGVANANQLDKAQWAECHAKFAEALGESADSLA